LAAQPYSRPPITEAVIEIRLAVPLDTADIAKVNSDFAPLYPLEQPVKNVGVAVGMPINPEGRLIAQIQNEENGYRRTSLDVTEILVLWRAAFSISQLAPYPGWDAFFGRFKRDWSSWKKRIGYRRIARIGVRYINRIDIPLSGSMIIEESEYLNVYPHLPKDLGPTMAYGVQAVLQIAEIGSRLTLNSSAVPSPLLDHAAFIFDQDIAKETELPQKDDDIFDLINQIRDKKNAIFEACMTDRSRELFRK
jgi:uncharacterized protein (TIGR04255 family)